MPTFRGITVALQSQYDALTIHEELPSSSPALPLNASISSLYLSSTHHSITHLPTPRSPVIDIGIPTFPSSQFWITYSCHPPHDSSKEANLNIRYYYFKLFSKNKCILSWGTGAAEDWCGKTMYGLFHAGMDFDGRKVIQKQGLAFPKVIGGGGSSFEIKVFRARARRREVVKFESTKGLDGFQMAFDMINLGRVRKGERQRMYTYALIDPKDEPYVTFSYTIQSDRGRVETLKSISDPAPHPQPLFSAPPSRQEHPFHTSDRTGTVSPRGRRKPVATSTRSEPASSATKPSDTDLNAREKRHQLEAETRRDWVSRTPSPMVSRLFDRPASPGARPKKVGSAGLLKNVVSRALTRERKDERDTFSWPG